MSKIVVACGAGVATSETVANKLRRLLDQEGVKNCNIVATDMRSVDRELGDADAFVYLAQPDKEYDVPVINGVAFLTGIGQKAEMDKLLAIVK